jgi:hypothetical protein
MFRTFFDTANIKVNNPTAETKTVTLFGSNLGLNNDVFVSAIAYTSLGISLDSYLSQIGSIEGAIQSPSTGNIFASCRIPVFDGINPAIGLVITEPLHGFSVGDAVFFNGVSWVFADFSTPQSSVYMVIGVIDPNTFIPSLSVFNATSGTVSWATPYPAGTYLYMQNTGATGNVTDSPTDALMAIVVNPTTVAIGYQMKRLGNAVFSSTGTLLGTFTATLATDFDSISIAEDSGLFYRKHDGSSDYSEIDILGAAETVVSSLPISATIVNTDPASNKSAISGAYTALLDVVADIVSTTRTDGAVDSFALPNADLTEWGTVYSVGGSISATSGGGLLVSDLKDIYLLPPASSEALVDEDSTFRQYSQMPARVQCLKIVAANLQQLTNPITYTIETLNGREERTIYPITHISADQSQPVFEACFCGDEQPIIDGESYFKWDINPNETASLRFFVKRANTGLHGKN